MTSDYTSTFTNIGYFVPAVGDTDQTYHCAFERHGQGWFVGRQSYNEPAGSTDGDTMWMRDLGKVTKLVDAAFPLGSSGEWDSMFSAPCSIITHGNTTMIYGHSGNVPHDIPVHNMRVSLWTIGKRRWSQIAGSGEFETPAFRANAAALTVNCNAVGGSIRVSVIDNETGGVMAGYSKSLSTSITTDTYAGAVTWGAEVLPVDREIRLRFHITSATLYSWTAGTES